MHDSLEIYFWLKQDSLKPFLTDTGTETHNTGFGLNEAYLLEAVKLDLLAFASHFVQGKSSHSGTRKNIEVKIISYSGAAPDLRARLQQALQATEARENIVFCSDSVPRMLLAPLDTPSLKHHPVSLFRKKHASSWEQSQSGGCFSLVAVAGTPDGLKELRAEMRSEVTAGGRFDCPHDFFAFSDQGELKDWIFEKALILAQGKFALLPFLVSAISNQDRFLFIEDDLSAHPLILLLKEFTFIRKLSQLEGCRGDFLILRDGAKEFSRSARSLAVIRLEGELISMRGFQPANTEELLHLLRGILEWKAKALGEIQYLGSNQQPALILDRDGTIIEHVHYLNDPTQVKLIPPTVELIRKANQLGWVTLMVSNQSGIGRGLISMNQWEAVQSRMLHLLTSQGARIDMCLFASVFREAKSRLGFLRPHWRKPFLGAMEYPQRLYRIDFSKSVMVGDSLVDMELGNSLGVRHNLLIGNKTDSPFPGGVVAISEMENFRADQFIYP